MVWLSRFIAAILISVITIAVLTQIFDATLLNSNYLNKVAIKDGLYSSLSVDISNQLVKDVENNNGSAPTISSQQASTIIKSVLTSSLIQTKVSSALSEVQAFYKGNGPQPSINLSDVIAKLQAAGLPISNNNQTLSKPIIIPSNQKVKQQIQYFEKLKLYSALATVILLVLLVFLSFEEHRWKVLPDLAIIVGVYLGLISAIFIFGVGVADKVAKLGTNSNDITITANNFAKSLTKGIGYKIAEIAIILIIVGIVSRIFMHRSNKNIANKKTQSKNSSLKLKPATK